MGVTHKLSPEVLNFVVQQKQSNPALGCRKLAEIVSAHFQINVSKSSINSVLKNANLSNSVGRPSKKVKEKMKKFQIPSDKKNQISQELQQIPLPENVQKQEAPVTAVEETVPGQGALTAQQDTGTEAEWGEVITMKNAGGMLLLAAFYETMDEALMGGLLNDYNSLPDRRDFERKCNAALLMSSLDIIDSAERDMLLHQQADFDFKADELQSFMNIETTDIDRILLQTKIDLELSQLANSASGFNLSLESGKVITLDPFLRIVAGHAGDPEVCVPMKSAIDKLSEELLVNNQPLLFTCSDTADTEDAEALMAALSGISGHKLINVSILGENGQAQLEFSYITEKSRQFIFGLLAGSKVLDRYVKASQWAERSSLEDRQGQEWEYSVTRTDYVASRIPGFSEELDVLTVWCSGGAEPVLALITNLKEDHKVLLERYLPYFMSADLDARVVADAATGQLEAGGMEYHTLGDVFNKFAEFLSCFVNREYISPAGEGDMSRRLLMIPGALHAGRAVVEIVLQAPDGDEELVKKLKKCAEIVNIRKVYDRKHRLLRFIVK